MDRLTQAKDTRFYDRFYTGGGWKYKPAQEARWLQAHVVEPLALTPCEVLDLGCGSGAHTEAWRQLGFPVLGVDCSATGIAWARQHYPEAQFLQADAADLALESASFDLIFARGMSWYHRHLDDRLRDATRNLCRLLRPGGLFVLAIKTDFSGRTDETSIVHNTLPAYLTLFEPLGEVVLCTDWHGRDLRTVGADGAENIVIATRWQP